MSTSPPDAIILGVLLLHGLRPGASCSPPRATWSTPSSSPWPCRRS
ncbi:hypothetical protein [Georgenia sp. SUBG003]